MKGFIVTQLMNIKFQEWLISATYYAALVDEEQAKRQMHDEYDLVLLLRDAGITEVFTRSVEHVGGVSEDLFEVSTIEEADKLISAIKAIDENKINLQKIKVAFKCNVKLKDTIIPVVDLSVDPQSAFLRSFDIKLKTKG